MIIEELMPVTSDPDHGLRIRIDHLSSKHHSDVLKSSINTQMVEKLELSEHPTLNYRNALKHTYRD